jgi:HSP20 family molecular chaperone IbpA
LKGSIFPRNREAITIAEKILVNAAGNFYINDKPTGAVVGQQPFGGSRANETNDSIIVKAELPGVDPKGVDISISGDNLTIKGEKTEEKEEKGKHFHRVERSYGSFSRTISLPKSVNIDAVRAEYKNGILEINLPKIEEAKAKKIEVKTVG